MHVLIVCLSMIALSATITNRELISQEINKKNYQIIESAQLWLIDVFEYISRGGDRKSEINIHIQTDGRTLRNGKLKANRNITDVSNGVPLVH